MLSLMPGFAHCMRTRASPGHRDRGLINDNRLHPPFSCVDQLIVGLFVLLCILLRTRRGFPRRLAAVELRDDLGADAVELFLGEDAEKAPREVERIKYRARFVGTCAEMSVV